MNNLGGMEAHRKKVSALYLRRVLLVLVLILSVSVMISSTSSAYVDIAINLNYPEKVITRHPQFIAKFDPDTSEVIDRESIRLKVNDEDYSAFLRQFIMDDGSLMLTFRSALPLPLGPVEFVLTGELLTGEQFRKRFIIYIEPESDPQLKPYIQRLRGEPDNASLYYKLGQIFESRFMLADAYTYYSRALELNPNLSKAKRACERIFATLGRKAIRKDDVVIDVSLNESLIDWANGIVVFEISIENYSEHTLKLDTSNLILSDGLGGYYKPVGDVLEYVRQQAKRGALPLETFAKLNYYLSTTPLPTLPEELELRPGGYVYGTVTFRLKRTNAKNLKLYIPKLFLDDRKLRFEFPFRRT